MTDDALDRRKLTAQPAFQRIDHVVHRAYRKRRIDLTMEIDDFAGAGVPHAHVVYFAKCGKLGGKRGENLAHPRNSQRICVDT